MAERGWQVPADARRSAGDDPIGSYLKTPGALAYETTLRAIVAAGDQPQAVHDWATRVCVGLDTQRQANADALLAAADVPDSPPTAQYFGLLDPSWPEGERMLAVLRRDYATGPLQRWDGAAWENVPAEMEPVGAPYTDLTDNVPLLVAALEASAYGQQLILRPGSPRAFLPREHQPALYAAVAPTPEDTAAHIYAIVDDLDSTAVLNLIQVSPGPDVKVRQNGQWVDSPDILNQLQGVDPPAVVEIDPSQTAEVTRQVDDYDTKNPAKGPVKPEDNGTNPTVDTLTSDGSLDFSDGVMVALFPEYAAAAELAVPNGQSVESLHCTLAYLGTIGVDVNISPFRLMEIVGTWAAGQPPLVGQVSGTGQFVDVDGPPVTYASVDVVGLTEARTDLIRMLAEAGVNPPSEHGFTPHITLLYGDGDIEIGNVPLRFNDVVVSYGDSDVRIPLGQSVSELIATAHWTEPSLVAVADPGRPAHSMMPEQLKHYWAHGEGALKIRWGVHGDFNRCRRHLAKYLNPLQLAGACAQLHKIATGFWPGPKAPG